MSGYVLDLAGRDCRDRLSQPRDRRANIGQSIARHFQNHDPEGPNTQVPLMLNVGIDCDEHIETSLNRIQQVTVLHARETGIVSSLHIVIGSIMAERLR